MSDRPKRAAAIKAQSKCRETVSRQSEKDDVFFRKEKTKAHLAIQKKTSSKSNISEISTSKKHKSAKRKIVDVAAQVIINSGNEKSIKEIYEVENEFEYEKRKRCGKTFLEQNHSRKKNMLTISLSDEEEELKKIRSRFDKSWLEYDKASFHQLCLECEDLTEICLESDFSFDCEVYECNLNVTPLKINIPYYSNKDLVTLNMECECIDENSSDSPLITCASDMVSIAQRKKHERERLDFDVYRLALEDGRKRGDVITYQRSESPPYDFCYQFNSDTKLSPCRNSSRSSLPQAQFIAKEILQPIQQFTGNNSNQIIIAASQINNSSQMVRGIDKGLSRQNSGNVIVLPKAGNSCNNARTNESKEKKKGSTKIVDIISVLEANQGKSEKFFKPELHDALYNSLATLGGSSTKKMNARLWLSIKPLPFNWPSNVNTLMKYLVKLDKLLNTERFKDAPIDWMVNRKLIQRPNCMKCRKPFYDVHKLQITRDVYEYWVCTPPCRVTQAFVYPSIFSDFKCPISKLLFMIYYWAIQVDMDDLLKSGRIEANFQVIHQVYKNLQSLCASVLAKEKRKFKSYQNKSVDLVTIQVGSLYVMGAMETYTGAIKIWVFHIQEIRKDESDGINVFIDKAKEWLEPASHVRICEKKFVSLSNFGFKLYCVSKKDFYHSSVKNPETNIGCYLIQHIQRLMKNVDVNSVTQDALHLILSELEWREKYGCDPFMAFQNIISFISSDKNPIVTGSQDIFCKKS